MYLGCNVIKRDITLPNGVQAKGIVYDMEPFLEQGVARYLTLAGKGTKLKAAKTPFIAQDDNRSDYRNPTKGESPCQWLSLIHI